MDNQSFELLMSKLDGLEAGQSRIENQINGRLDKHYELFQDHVKDDKDQADRLEKHIGSLDKEITFAKGVTYTINTIAAVVYGLIWGSK